MSGNSRKGNGKQSKEERDRERYCGSVEGPRGRVAFALHEKQLRRPFEEARERRRQLVAVLEQRPAAASQQMQISSTREKEREREIFW